MPEIAGGVGGSEQQQGLTRPRQRPDALQKRALQNGADRQRLRQQVSASELVGGQARRELDQREGISVRALDQAVAERRRELRREQRVSCLAVETGEPKLRQPLESGRLPVARCKEQHDTLRLEAPRRERERLGGRAVEPLSIVHDAKQRLLVRSLREQAQHADGDQETVARLARRESESTAQRVSLRLWDSVDLVEYRQQDPLQRGERELRLRLDPDAPEDAQVLRTLDRVAEERRLADPWLAADDECSTPRLAGLEEQALDSGALHAPADEHGVIVDPQDASECTAFSP